MSWWSIQIGTKPKIKRPPKTANAFQGQQKSVFIMHWLLLCDNIKPNVFCKMFLNLAVQGLHTSPRVKKKRTFTYPPICAPLHCSSSMILTSTKLHVRIVPLFATPLQKLQILLFDHPLCGTVQVCRS